MHVLVSIEASPSTKVKQPAFSLKTKYLFSYCLLLWFGAVFRLTFIHVDNLYNCGILNWISCEQGIYFGDQYLAHHHKADRSSETVFMLEVP